MSENDILPVNNQDEVANEVIENATPSTIEVEKTEVIEEIVEAVEAEKTSITSTEGETEVETSHETKEEIAAPAKPKRVTKAKKAVETNGEAVAETSQETAEETAAPAKAKRTPKAKKTEETEESKTEADMSTEGEAVVETSQEAKEENLQIDELLEVSTEEMPELEDDDDEQDDEIEADADYSSFTREELICKLNDLLQEEDIDKIKPKVGAIKVAFIEKTKAEFASILAIENVEESTDEEGAPAEPIDALEQRFNEVFNVYKEKKAKHLEQLEEQKRVNLLAKQQILEQLKELINTDESLKTTYDKFKELQEQWKEIGAVPKAEVNNLWQNYHFLVEKFFDKVKINRELRDLDTKKNLEAKISLCEKVEELILEKSIMKSFKKLQGYHQEWKEIGPVPNDKREELWERFKTATDKINARRKEHYFVIKDQQDANCAAKLAFVEEAKKITEDVPTTLKGWQDKGIQLNDLFKSWKTIGPAAKAENEKLWDEFKSVLDGFFAIKKDYFSKLKDEQYNNYNLKLDLCAQAEAVKDSTNWGETTKILINLQNEWKKIGSVPKRMSEKIWKRFRGACDEFFKRKDAHFANASEHYEGNLAGKKALIEAIKNLVINPKNSHESFDQLKQLQRDWMEIGHVPMKEKDAIQKAYRDAVNAKLDELKAQGVQISNTNFKNKIENIRSNPNANHIINKERNLIFTKIQSMKEDVSLWENNIGFLSRSKNAELLKAEFEKKIQNAKQEIIELEEKLKILDEQGA